MRPQSFWGSRLLVSEKSGACTEPEKRKRVNLRRANPFSNLRLLFTNGAGLRRLSLMAVFYFACLGGQSVSMMPYRFGVLGWTPYQSFYFNSAKNVVDSATHGALVLPCLARFGSKRTFELGALCNAAACLVWSQSWRFGPAVGVASLRST